MKFSKQEVSLAISNTIADNDLPCHYYECDGPNGNESFIHIEGDRAEWIENATTIPHLHLDSGDVIISSEAYWDLAERDMLDREFKESANEADLQDYCYWHWGCFVSFVNLLDLTNLSLHWMRLPRRWIEAIGYLHESDIFMSFEDIGHIIGNKVYIDKNCDHCRAWSLLTRQQQYQFAAYFRFNKQTKSNERKCEYLIIENLKDNGVDVEDEEIQDDARYISERGYWYEYDPRDAFWNHFPC